MSRDIPIIFSGPMVRAIMEGRKTQTRRILTRQPEPFSDDAGKQCDVGILHVEGEARPRVTLGRVVTTQQVRYAVGDRLWVRENIWQASPYAGTLPCGEPDESQRWSSRLAFYSADGDPPNTPNRHYPEAFKAGSGHFSAPDPYASWLQRPSIHMPRWASRLTLLVEGVKIERLQDISEEDAVAEGVDRLFTEEECRTVVGLENTRPEDHGWRNYLWHGLIGNGITAAQADAWPHQFSSYKSARDSFSSLWARLHGPDAWAVNPFVVAPTFRVIKANIDAPEARAAK